jgi:hypothetical protein
LTLGSDHCLRAPCKTADFDFLALAQHIASTEQCTSKRLNANMGLCGVFRCDCT